MTDPTDTPASTNAFAPRAQTTARACEGCNADPGEPCLPHCLPHEPTEQHSAPADEGPSTNDETVANTTYGQKNATLVFPLAKVLAAAEHAATADKHKLGSGETEAAPRLWWVKDDGTFLMSNGQDPTDTRADNGRLVHADGWGPGTNARTILGGDDFRQSIDLTTPVFEDGTTLLGMLRAAAAEGATRFLLKATFDNTYMDLTYITE
ncbi:DUF3085 domain-containing protein [Streptomyces sp. PT19]|uniref:DUF3085 domain-containing protein n=1 Tax=Streptomyces sp. PT19 TaxID=3452239 RepID=UPI003F817BE6